ncbi:MAG: tellurite resistance TerB family protein [Gammaproteobacteria bacterium]|nr:tellurite resistance TerB family protein [Gammaproteobacteria bacterium]
MNTIDILGSLMKANMGASSGRLDTTFGNAGFGTPAGSSGGLPAGGSSGGIFDVLGKLAGSMLGGGTSAPAPGTGGGGFSSGDILGSLGKLVLGGSKSTGPGSAGAGTNAIFGALAAQALVLAKRMMAGEQSAGGSQSIDIDDATAVIAGLRRPANAREEQQVRDVATLTVKAMINAAKADGHIDKQETERLVGKLREDGITDEEQRFVMEEMRKPMDTDTIVQAVPNEQIAAQIYTASLMAINVDTDAEKRYMQELASKLGLNQQVTAYLHQAVGMS